jgi:uncharacterized membrane protein
MTAILILTTAAMAAMLVLMLSMSTNASGAQYCCPPESPERRLAERYARGEITAYDYKRILDVIRS